MSSAVVLIANAAMALAALPASPLQQRVASESSRYLKWLNEDGVYIIMDKERAEFLKLTTDEQRDQFIQQFWQDRNSPPGAPKHGAKPSITGESHWPTSISGRHQARPVGRRTADALTSSAVGRIKSIRTRSAARSRFSPTRLGATSIHNISASTWAFS